MTIPWKAGPLLFLFAVPLSAAVEAVHVPAREYAAVAEREIDAARKSIHLSLYLFGYQPVQTAAAPARLARALVRARERGVRVEVVLDPGAKVYDANEKNRPAAEFLLRNGIDVFFTEGPTQHSKVLVVDGRTVLLGSTNWTSSAFTENGETNGLVRSTTMAAGILRELAAHPRRPAPKPESDPGATPVPASFLFEDARLGEMVRRKDEAGLDGTLYLLRFCALSPERCEGEGFFAVPAQEFASAMGWPALPPVDARRQVRRVLLRLRDIYKLIDFTDHYGRDSSIRLLPAPAGPAVRLPGAYFEHGWDRRLEMPGKVFVLLNLHHSPASPIAPRWSISERILSEKHHTSLWFIRQGVTELRRRNLVEVEYDTLPTAADPLRHPNTYTPNPLYDAAALAARFQALETAHGPAALARARKLAALVYEDDDGEGIESLIDLEKRYGREVVDEAAGILGAKNPDNPKRSIKYLIGTIKNLAEKAAPQAH